MAEKDYSVIVAAFVALVAIVGLVTQLGAGSSGARCATYGSYPTENPSLQRGTCPAGYTATNIVCTGSVRESQEDHQSCYNTGELYCVSDNFYWGQEDAQPREYGKEQRFVARAERCLLTPADEEGGSYYLCS